MPIVLSDVYAGYMPGRFVVSGVSLNTVFVGPNASGKTTIFRVIAGLSPVVKGEVRVDGIPIEKIRGIPGLVSINLPEILLPYNIPVRDIAKLYVESTGGDWIRFLELARSLNLTRELDKRFAKLSAGSKTLVLNSIAIASSPRYLLLDEPFENVDPARRVVLLREILGFKGIVLLNTHTTWLLKHLDNWSAVLVVSGKTHGPVRVEKLITSRVTSTDSGDCFLKLDLDTGRSVCLSSSSGKPVSELDSLDKLYEVVLWSLQS